MPTRRDLQLANQNVWMEGWEFGSRGKPAIPRSISPAKNRLRTYVCVNNLCAKVVEGDTNVAGQIFVKRQKCIDP